MSVPTPTVEPTAPLSTAPDRRARVVAIGRLLVAPLVLAVVSVVLVLAHVGTYDKVGPMDELQHIDSLIKAPAQVRAGEKIGDAAMEIEACRGLDYPMPLPRCVVGGDYDPDDFQERGYNTASVNTPIYYTVTKVVAAVVAPFSPGDELLDDARLAGVFWLTLGVLLTYVVGRRLGASRWALVAVLVAVVSSQSVLYLSATVTPDAAALAVGAGAILSVLWWERRPGRRSPVLVAVLVLSLLLKMTNVVVWFAVGLYVLLRLVDLHVLRRPADAPVAEPSSDVTERAMVPSVRWFVVAAGLMVASAGAVLGGLSWYQARLAIPDAGVPPMQTLFQVDSLDPVRVLDSVGALLNPLQSAIVAVGSEELSSLGQRIAGLLIVAGLVATALFGSERGRTRSLAQAGLLTALVAGPALVVISYVAQGVYIPPPPRYAITLVPLMVVVTARSLRTVPARVCVTAAAVGCLGITLLRLVVF